MSFFSLFLFFSVGYTKKVNFSFFKIILKSEFGFESEKCVLGDAAHTVTTQPSLMVMCLYVGMSGLSDIHWMVGGVCVILMAVASSVTFGFSYKTWR